MVHAGAQQPRTYTQQSSVLVQYPPCALEPPAGPYDISAISGPLARRPRRGCRPLAAARGARAHGSWRGSARARFPSARRAGACDGPASRALAHRAAPRVLPRTRGVLRISRVYKSTLHACSARQRRDPQSSNIWTPMLVLLLLPLLPTWSNAQTIPQQQPPRCVAHIHVVERCIQHSGIDTRTLPGGVQFRCRLRSFRCLHGSSGWIRYFEQPLDHFNAEAVRRRQPRQGPLAIHSTFV